MLPSRKNTRKLIAEIFHCQKEVIINRRLIEEKINFGQDSSDLEHKNKTLMQRIITCQAELKMKNVLA